MAIENSSFHRTKSGTLRGASSLLMIQRGTVLRQDFGATKGNGGRRSGRACLDANRIARRGCSPRLKLFFFFFIKVIYASHRKNWQYGSELKDSLFIILASWFSISRVPSIFSYFSSCTKKKNGGEGKRRNEERKKKKKGKRKEKYSRNLFFSLLPSFFSPPFFIISN